MDFLTRYDQSNCSCCTDVVSLLGQINTIFAIWFAAINLVDCSFFFFFSVYLLVKVIRSSLLSSGRANTIVLCVCVLHFRAASAKYGSSQARG